MKKIVKGVMSAACLSLVLALGAAGCGPECEVHECSEIVEDSSLSSNDREYDKCISCYSDGTCRTILKDEEGEVFFDCEDEPGSSCTEASVNAQFAYCEVQ